MRFFTLINQFIRIRVKAHNVSNLQYKTMSNDAPRTLFDDTGNIDANAVYLTVGAPAERHLEKVAEFIDKSAQATKVRMCCVK